MQTEQKPLILTLRLDEASQAFFNELREQYFPAERNYLKAHLTLFHQLPNRPETFNYFKELRHPPFKMTVSGLRHLGAGVAYKIESLELLKLHKAIAAHFKTDLIPQDLQNFQPHITIQNKVTPEDSIKLLNFLSDTFDPFPVKAIGLDLWTYLGGPWQHEQLFLFKQHLQ